MYDMWSEFDRKLIEEIRENYRVPGCLSPTTWIVIGNKLLVPPVKCRKRWKSIRDMYVKIQKKNKKGKISKQGLKYCDGSLSFIDSTIRTRKPNHKRSNKNYHNTQETSSESNTKYTMADDYHDNNSSQSKLDDEKQDSGVTTFVTQDMIESLLKKKSNETDDYENNAHVLQAISTMSDNLARTIIQHTLSNEKDENLESAETEITFTEMSTSALTQEIEHHKPIDGNESTSDTYFVKDENVDELEPYPISHINRDNIDTPSFFRDIGDFVSNRFPTEKQLEIRLKICSIVANAEKEIFQDD